MTEMYNELSLASPGGFKAKHDDFIDTISMLGSLTTWRPSETTELSRGDGDIWELDEKKEFNSRLHSYIV